MKNRNQPLSPSSHQSAQTGFYDRTSFPSTGKESSVAKAGDEARAKPSGTGLMSLCKEIAGTLIRRYAETGDSQTACREVRMVLTEKLECRPERASAIIDLSLELIRLNAYGEYRRNDLEMSLLVSRAAGHLRETDLN